jgi:hypothetical protein
MKKSSGLKNVGGDTGKLIVYSDPDFQGEEHTFLGLYIKKKYIPSTINSVY